ncbi:hypothetical protein OHT52_04960 [Streptomyces sp. NBC_00247]|uniref:hypothetical protein n=1 Tax=Streptomyces sp. NBC_00247 TaxID=2975689 RepID=UPI002E2B24C0|nr:hypothetical protein [Streptomyces sp. NBC_00247]
MTGSADLPEAGRWAAAALCVLLGSPGDLAQPGVREPAERARDLLRSGADAGVGTEAGSGPDGRAGSGADELAACYAALNTALRRAGDARGLVAGGRSARISGIARDVKVAVCPGPAHCSRVERARDLLPAPACAVNGTRMSRRRLGPGQ